MLEELIVFEEQHPEEDSADDVDLSEVTEDEVTMTTLRDWFKEDVDASMQWRELGRQDYSFYFGDQWEGDDIDLLDEQKRPAITINRIKPHIDLLSGYQRLNRYEPNFLPRNRANPELCQVRKGVTKWIWDQSDYEEVESRICLDAYICGKGWFETCYEWDFASLTGIIRVKRASPFDIYVDSNSREPNCSDANRMHRAKWTDKGQVKQIYPEHAETIEQWTSRYDADEDEFNDDTDLWYQRDTNKCRLVETWWKEWGNQQFYLLNDGTLMPVEKMPMERMQQLLQVVTLPGYKMMYAAYLGDVMLEKPKVCAYEHNEFPFVPLNAYYIGEGDIHSGVVRHVIDVQREINKRRSQNMHIVNTQSNSGWQYQQGALNEEMVAEYEDFGSTPGAMLTWKQGQPKPERITPVQLAQSVIEAENAATADISTLSNINPQVMGSQTVPVAESGRAVELHNRLAVTGITMLFDNLKSSQKDVLQKLWGRGTRKGLIQQYMTEEMTMRVLDDSGKPQFVVVNQQIQIQHPLLGVVQKTINDLTVGEFDIAISQTPVTPTQRIAQFWAFVDAIAQLGIPGDMVFDIVLDLSDIPQKEELKQRFAARQEQQKQVAMLQLQAKHAPQPPKISISAPLKDWPANERMQIAAKVGLQPQPADFGLPPGPPPNIAQLAQAALARLGGQGQGPAPMVPQAINPALIRQRYLANRPVATTTRTIQPVSQLAARSTIPG
ncbi:MAG: hypothetical protein P4N59_03440 [Negativicutes bacterium]|nr:hypothetical protein [Negativicutes bacterium]